jgi:hypothetical protein
MSVLTSLTINSATVATFSDDSLATNPFLVSTPFATASNSANIYVPSALTSSYTGNGG